MHSFARNWHLPFLNQQRERMIVENISWSSSMKECCRPSGGRTRNLLITSWTRIQLIMSHCGRKKVKSPECEICQNDLHILLCQYWCDMQMEYVPTSKSSQNRWSVEVRSDRPTYITSSLSVPHGTSILYVPTLKCPQDMSKLLEI